MSYGVGCRRGLDPALLLLCQRLEATAPIRPLAWEPPYALGEALEKAKRQKKKKKVLFWKFKWALENNFTLPLIAKSTSSTIPPFFWPCLGHVEVFKPKIKPMPQQQPKLLKWQHWVCNLLCHKGTPLFPFKLLFCSNKQQQQNTEAFLNLKYSTTSIKHRISDLAFYARLFFLLYSFVAIEIFVAILKFSTTCIIWLWFKFP